MLLVLLFIQHLQVLLLFLSLTRGWNTEQELLVLASTLLEPVVAALDLDCLLPFDQLECVKWGKTHLSVQVKIAAECLLLELLVNEHGDLEWLILLHTDVALLLWSYQFGECFLHF